MPGRPIAHEGVDHSCPLREPKEHIGGPVFRERKRKRKQKPTTFVGPESKFVALVGDQAQCKVAPLDTVRGGLITVWIDGQPAAREGDATDAGKITKGLDTVHLGEHDKRDPIPRWIADWLFEYLAGLEEIPYEYTGDGCYARADRMAHYIEALDIPVKKRFMQAWGASKLSVVPRVLGGQAQGWGWHVAPIVPVQGEGYLVFDPTVHKGGPMTLSAWEAALNQNKVEAYAATAPATVYKYWLAGTRDKKAPPGGSSQEPQREGVWEVKETRDPEKTAKDLELFRGFRSEARMAAHEIVGTLVFHY